MTSKDYYRAYLFWTQSYPFLEADQFLKSYLEVEAPAFGGANFSWIKVSREALLIPPAVLAERLGLAKASIGGLEKSEMSGTLTLGKLDQIAKAMDCELVYALRPRQKILYSHVIWRQLLKDSLSHWWVRTRTENRKARALAWVAKLKFESSPYRKGLGWARQARRRQARSFSRSGQGTEEFDW